MIGRLGSSITHSLNHSILPPLSACSAPACAGTADRSSAVKDSVRPPALLRNPQGDVLDKRRVGCYLIRVKSLMEDGRAVTYARSLNGRASLGHKDVKTTMVYTHVLNRGPSGVRNPVDGL
jgi:hypothetical protein